MTEIIKGGEERKIEDLHHKFINVRTKIKNPKLSDDSAWIEAQPLISYFILDCPNPNGYNNESFMPVRKIFNIRRRAYFDIEFRKDASVEVKKIYNDLDDKKKNRFAPIIKLITDFFEVSSIPRRR